MRKQIIVLLFICSPIIFYVLACNTQPTDTTVATADKKQEEPLLPTIDTSKIPNDSMGNLIRYGRNLMLYTAYYIGPNGINGKYLGNKMNCTNCHQDAGTKPFAFNLMSSHDDYPQYRAREGRVLTLAERVNNCVMRPHNGKPLPLDSREMVAFLSYLKWINSFVVEDKKFKGTKPLAVEFLDRPASPIVGKQLFAEHCQRCHGPNGEGIMAMNDVSFQYPPVWGANSYQPGSSMHRVIKQAQWLKANMPYDSATWFKPVLSDAEALDLAAFVNDDAQHKRPSPKTLDYPNAKEKAIDYAHAPFADTFSEASHKFGPYAPIVKYWKDNGWKPTY
jgi:thiosulfate dehydrogenase